MVKAADEMKGNGAFGPLTQEVVSSIEALLVVASEPLSASEISDMLAVDLEVVAESISTLRRFYDESRRAFYLAEIGGGYQIRTRPEFESVVKRYIDLSYKERLSKAALEVLAIVAYRQPISRAQITHIRGVNSDATLRLLVERGYIESKERDDGPGKALLFRTTRLFLERLGLYSLEELPPLDEFVPDARVVEDLEEALFSDSSS